MPLFDAVQLAYWLVENVPLDQFGPIQKAIARRFGGEGRAGTICRG